MKQDRRAISRRHDRFVTVTYDQAAPQVSLASPAMTALCELGFEVVSCTTFQ